MAQAARLNLRMQKEIKLLMNDPPPGVSLNLSEDESVLSSLLSFEARIEGPEGTVYSKGIFILKIQIPERYPFQPPNVTFVTPIYHPNIDNGGRICLDILNLPPKGAWQPSLNISTVLTSIGLLLSEPNPDDGLMAEISREYKYNRQVFDINAQSWTEKYANSASIGTSGWGSIDVSVLSQKSQMEEVRSLDTLLEVSNIECEKVSRKKMRLLGQKLSLKSEPEVKTTSKQNLVVSHLPYTAKSTDPTTSFSHDVTAKQSATSKEMVVCTDSAGISNKECQGNRKNLQLGRLRLPYTSQAPSNRSNVDGEDILPNQLLASASNPKDPIWQSLGDVLEKSVTMPKSADCSSENLNKASKGTRVNVKLLSQKLSLESEKHDKKSNDHSENMTPNQFPSSIPSSNTLLKGSSDVDLGNNSSGGGNLVQQDPNVVENTVVPNTKVISNKECDGSRKKLSLLNKKLSLKSELAEMDRHSNKEYKPSDCSQKDRKRNELALSASPLKNHTIGPCSADPNKVVNKSSCPIKQNANAVETIVVSDSEESADECDRPSRSRLSLMKRRLAGKLKS